MKPGSKPKPTAVKLAHGNPGHRRLEKDLVPGEGTTTPPAWLDPIAKTEWRRLRKRLERFDLLTPNERAVFAAYCAQYSLMQQSSAYLQRPELDGRLSYCDDKGKLAPLPEVIILRQSADMVRKLAAEFGMTPAERSRVGRPAGAGPKEKRRAFLFGNDPTGDPCEDAPN